MLFLVSIYLCKLHKYMETHEITLRDRTFDLVKEASKIRGKDISSTIDDLLCQYFTFENRKSIHDIEIKFNENDEIWKDIPGYEGLYQASNMGRIASIRSGFKLRSLVRSPVGYVQCAIRIKNKSKNYMVHHLIANTFLPPPVTPEYTQIDHINNIKYDNRAINLQRVTPSQNIKHNYNRGISNIERTGIKKRVKLFNKEGKSIGIFDSVKDAAKFLNTSIGNVSSLCNGKHGIKSLTKNKITGKFIRPKRPNYRKLNGISQSKKSKSLF